MKVPFKIQRAHPGLLATLCLLAAAVPGQAQSTALDELRAKAEAGDAEAQNAVGLAYKNGGTSRWTSRRRSNGSKNLPSKTILSAKKIWD